MLVGKDYGTHAGNSWRLAGAVNDGHGSVRGKTRALISAPISIDLEWLDGLHQLDVLCVVESAHCVVGGRL